MSKRGRSGITKTRDTRPRFTARKSKVPTAAQLRDVVAQLPPPVRSLNGSGPGFPKKLRVRLKYGENFTYASLLAGTTAYNTFRANSIFDPDQTNVGHQPRYHDQLAALYGYYYVEKCTIKATFHNASDQAGLIAYVIPDASTGSPAVPATVSDLIEWPNSTYLHMSGENAGPAPSTITKVINMKDYQEETRTNRQAFGTNPTDAVYLNVGVFNGSAATSGAWVVVELIYDVVCSELIEPSQS